jgi:hypothetical protein
MAADKTELRGLAPTELANALDCIALSKGMDRNTYVLQVLDAEVRKVMHEFSVLQRTMRGNPYLSEHDGATRVSGQ